MTLHTFDAFVVTFKDVEWQQNKLVPVITL